MLTHMAIFRHPDLTCGAEITGDLESLSQLMPLVFAVHTDLSQLGLYDSMCIRLPNCATLYISRFSQSAEDLTNED